MKYTEEQLLEAIKNSAGIMSTIADRLNCNWHTAKKKIDENEIVKVAYESECERVLDLAESKMIGMVEKEDGQMIRYLLSTKGKKRGFSERYEVTGKDGEDLFSVFKKNLQEE